MVVFRVFFRLEEIKFQGWQLCRFPIARVTYKYDTWYLRPDRPTALSADQWSDRS